VIPGDVLGKKYELEARLGKGGMGEVWRARHVETNEHVAVKVLLDELAQDSALQKRFLREARAAAAVKHPNVVELREVQEGDDGAPFLVMELLDGDSLEAWMNRTGGTLPLPDVLAIADQVLDVLGAFHARGVIHRDIKPGNLFVTKSGLVKVLDFGLARLRDPKFTAAPTATGIVLGTASYMPPEQAQGKSNEVDSRSDIFAVGAVMFRALTGRTVHDAKGATERLFQAMKDRAPSLGIVAPHIPTWVVGVVDKALAFDKKDRWATAELMRKAVRETFAQLKEEAQRVRPAPGSIAPEHDVSVEVSEIFGAMLEPSIVVDISFSDMLPASAPPLPKKD
jgi:eukaryotic-like serine/threonine-protein kinase